VVTNSHGGNTSMSIRWIRRNGCGKQLIEAQKLRPQLQYWRLIIPYVQASWIDASALVCEK
jgi:hypothetical protein